MIIHVLSSDMKYKLVSFDMDKTLTRDSSVFVFLMTFLGRKDVADDFQKRYDLGKISDRDVATEFAKVMTGIRGNYLKEIIDTIPLIDGIEKSLKILHKNGFVVGITSVGPSFAIERMCERFGFDFSIGTEHIFKNGIHTGKIGHLVALEDKPNEVIKMAKKFGIASFEQIVAVGDSRSDVELFKKVGFSIAINATKEAKDAASFSIETDNLVDVVEIISRNQLVNF